MPSVEKLSTGSLNYEWAEGWIRDMKRISQLAPGTIRHRHGAYELRAHGICFSLGDLGTGYSSLAYLKCFPLAALKIDRSFVRDVGTNPESVSIVEAIIALARKLKLDIVAEGVEDEAQRNFLIHGGCSSMQGFLLGRPVPIAEYEHIYSADWIVHA
jgi:EAL domain-containing protein (putative c-di-GMP-specific phosphodiesterase class I)